MLHFFNSDDPIGYQPHSPNHMTSGPYPFPGARYRHVLCFHPILSPANRIPALFSQLEAKPYPLNKPMNSPSQKARPLLLSTLTTPELKKGNKNNHEADKFSATG
jgi:hypothetical protein